MKRFLLLALPALALALAGCGSDDPTSPPAGNDAALEQQAIAATMAEVPELAETETYELPGEAEFADAFAPAGQFATAAAIRPVFFYRTIREHTRDIHIETERDTAFETARVRVVDHFAGGFHLVVADSTDTGVVVSRIRKPLRDDGVMRAVFRRPLDWDRMDPATGDSTGDRERDRRCRGWRLVATSHREIASPEHTTKIVSVRLEAASGLDLLITDPLALMRFPGELPRVFAGEPVKVTVQVEDPTDHVFLLCGWGRLRLRPVADGVFEGGFKAPYDLRRFRIGVNALDRATLLDDVAPYDSDFWGLLGHTVPPMMATQ
jgi:hypothetical protein